RTAPAAAAALVAAGLALGACGDSGPSTPAPGGSPASSGGPAPSATATPAASADRGRQIWLGQCIACHHPDPSKDGPVGPAVKGSSPELLEARVVKGEYPPGYTPKRPTRAMPPRPDLAPTIPDLAAYLR
ncbi:MAG TPA: cytochrome c, partial [Methylomirabilota bacterium]|nr:cytochrome c [Methylomirabilota bacterium]